MASGNYIMALTFSIFIVAILSSAGAPVTPTVIMCQSWSMCGAVAYNPQENQCCLDGSVRSLSLLCGPKLTYDPCSERCCPDSVLKKYIVVNKTREGTERTDCGNKKLQLRVDIR
ncbi:insulin growth factor-like family member 2 [Dromiciops gliroides]|uniref:insulin growth factor-like family member 2 n=1 Tax=Dromiciops gliroides TaxID=33562 RepID=UPI001CC383D1|nr:insulin growth factor-like family member 2 [Dromiciops gliroides]